MVFYIYKIKKNKVACYAVADELLAKWLSRELWQSENGKLSDYRSKLYFKDDYFEKEIDCNLDRSCRKTIEVIFKSLKLIGYCVS